MQLVSKNHFSLSNLYVPFLLSHESKANISETPNKKGRKYIYMNLKETRDKLIGNNAEKLKLLNSNYLDQTVELLRSDFTDDDFKINLQIISALAITKNSNAKSKIRKIIPSYFETARDYVNAVVSNFNDNNSNTIYTLEEFIVNAVENKANTIEIDSNEEDSNYVKFDWKDEKQKNEQFGKADKSLPIGEQISQTNGDNRFIIVDLEHHTPSNESTLNYIYEESNHRFILQSDGAQDMPELPSPLDLQRQDSDDDLAYDMDPGMIPLRVRRNFDINDGSILDAPRSAESQSTTISVVSNINDRIEEIISGDNFSEFGSPNFSRNDISEHLDYHSADDMSRTNQTDEELVRLINYIQSSRTVNQTEVANSLRSDLASDISRQNFQNSNSYEYDELNIPALNSVLVQDRLTEEETERISASLNDYRRRSDLLVAIRNEANDETNNHYQYEQVLQPIPLLDAMREAVLVDGMQDTFQCDDQYNDTATKTLVTPLPSAAVNVCKDDMLFSDSQVTQNADESYHESDFADQFMVNMKSTIVYTYPPQSKQDVVVSIFQSLFHIVKETSYFSDGILFFALWFLKNENSAFLEKYYRKCCMDNAHKILLCLSIRNRTNDMIDSICYIKDFKIDKFNIQAYKSVMTKSNNHFVDFDHIYKLVNGAFGDFSFDALECYINYAKNIDSKKKEAHYMKIVGLMKKTINKDTNKTLLLLSKLALYSEEAQNICNKNHMVEMTIVTFNKQMMLGHSPKYAIFCLYSLCDAWEQNRKIVIKQKIMATVFDIFKRKLKEKNFDKEFLAIVCLIKCMTRCVQFLTSELLEFPIMELFLLAIKNASKIKNSKNFDVSTIFSTTDCNEKELCAFAILKESFCVLSNLVMDHGNYKDKFLSKNGLKIIYSVGKKTNLEFYMLFLLKNFLYECTWPVKETFMEVFTNEKYKINKKKVKNQETHKDLSEEPLPLSDEYNHETNNIDNYVKNTIQHISKTLESGKFYIQTKSKNIFTRTLLKYNKINLNKTNHRTRSRMKTMKEMFNVIRNMVCASKDETFDFFVYYPAILENTILYFIRLMRSTNFNTQKKRVIIETIYIFSNICASTDEYKDIFMQPFFTAEIQKLFSIRNRDLILAMVWFITNLSWIEDENGYERNKRMVEIGYKKYLLDMSAIDAYIHDKAVHAIDNLST